MFCRSCSNIKHIEKENITCYSQTQFYFFDPKNSPNNSLDDHCQSESHPGHLDATAAATADVNIKIKIEMDVDWENEQPY